ncbi:sensor histidine kinase N-terminal domain-containing protein [Shewanella mesophila]|uniref:ATP-binding protein n=1 Tax=Shewanella mesophila TaxID=2864208 RepID=UPI001C6605E0|nr:ATP-binding protein [Shewanella mesophila]QYJ86396.1 sensor histidine kinase N-terminal domain-containing protein [Shewanella mesophila]
MYSLRLMLTLLILCGIGLSVGLSSWMSTSDASDQIEELFDAQLLQTAKTLELFYHYEITASKTPSLTEQALVLHIEDSNIESFTEKSDALKLAYEHKLAFQVWSVEREALMRSDNIPKRPFTDFKQGYHLLERDGQLWHVFSYFSTPNNVWIITAQQDEVRRELVSQIMRNAFSAPALVVPLILIAILLLSYWLFKPLKALERLLNQRKPHDVTPIAMPLPSELKPVQTALNLYISRFAHAIARERRFSADAAHELKTPLSVIKLHQDGLKELIPSSNQATLHLNAIDTGVARLSHTVEQLLLLARVDSIEELDLGCCNVQSMVEAALNQLIPGIADFEWDINIPPELSLQGDHFYLELVLRNIIENACKYSPKESLISIGAIAKQNSVEINITDSGKGMTKAQIDNAIERFYRVNENEGTGAGLGLSICQHIIELHNGRLSISQHTTGGVQVIITFPNLTASH